MESQKSSNTSFEEYRNKMHPEEEQGRSVVPTPGHSMRIAFAIFMIIIYVGVGVLMICNVFNWDASWAWARYVVGILLILYGVFRAYRYYVGSDYYNK